MVERTLFSNPRMKRSLAAAIIAIIFALQLHLAVVLNVNWDEFFFLSKVYAFRDGRLSVGFQTFHVHMFGWLTTLPLSEVGQIVAGRMIMLLAEGGTAVCIFIMGRKIFDPRCAAFAVIIYLCSGYVLQHAASFRADPIATFTMMASLALLVAGKRSVVMHALAGIVAALGLLVTIKCVLYLPAFMGALAYRLGSDEPRIGLIKSFSLTAACFAAIYAIGWTWHANAVAHSTSPEIFQSRAGGALEKTMLTQTWFPQWPYLLGWAMASMAAAAILFAGIAMAAVQFFRQNRVQAATLLLFAAPLLSLAIYRNSFPYFFPFIIAPAILAAGPVLERLRSDVWRVAVLVLLIVPVGMQYGRLLGQDQSAQRAVIAAVHEMFPKPVPYIGRNGMVPSFPKVGFFMSTWGMEKALSDGRPLLSYAVANEKPVFVILNSPFIKAAFEPKTSDLPYRLHPLDEATLRNNYIPHWGAIRVAGRALESTGGIQQFHIAVPGIYTLECRGKGSVIDAHMVACGSVVNLSSGSHSLNASRGGHFVLRWGDHLPVPKTPPPDEPIYYGF